MKTSPRAGFTIMETTLFLAITGLLILMVTAGTGISLGTQRYRDAVETLKSTVQQQYAELSSTENGRDAQYACTAAALPVESTDPELRGQSKCSIVGRYLRIVNDKVTIYNVLAVEKATQVSTDGKTDIQVMKANYTYNIDPQAVTDKTLEWGTKVSWPTRKGIEHSADTGATRTAAFLFIRSPYSGQIYTFSPPNGGTINDGHIRGMMQEGTTLPSTGEIGGRAARVVCVDSQGLVLTGTQAIYIGKNATSAAAIEVVNNEFLKAKPVAEGGEVQC